MLPELARVEEGSELIAHIRDIQESAVSRQLDSRVNNGPGQAQRTAEP